MQDFEKVVINIVVKAIASGYKINATNTTKETFAEMEDFLIKKGETDIGKIIEEISDNISMEKIINKNGSIVDLYDFTK